MASDFDNLKTRAETQGKDSFLNYLRRKKIFDINDRRLKPLQQFISHVPAGQPAVVSNQGQDPTCSSHAVGKAVVELLDGFNLDCKQEKIIDHLVNVVQPDKTPVPITAFNDKQIDLEFWDKGSDPNEFTEARASLLVQCEYPSPQSPSWREPAMTMKQLTDNRNSRMIAVYDPEPDQKDAHDLHAVYVQSFQKIPKNPKDKNSAKYSFTCINSWGGVRPHPCIPNTQIKALYYIFLFCDSYIFLSSTGPSAEYQGARLGRFREEGEYNKLPFYRQVSTVRPEEDNFLYNHTDDGSWLIGRGMDGVTGLGNTSKTDTIPMSGWKCYGDGQLRDDPSLKISSEPPAMCGDITIEATGDAADKQPRCLGVYRPNGVYNMGRRVFKHQTQELYLLVIFGYVAWFVLESVDADNKTSLMKSACAPCMCPADPRARTSERMGWKSWEYRNTDGKLKEGDITVRCSVHTCELT